jgi:hypothetical protein
VIYVLAPAHDESAPGFAAAIQRRGEACEWVLPEQLMLGSTLSYRIDAGGASSLVELQDGRVLSSSTAALVLNRLVELPAIVAANSVDAAYLEEEWRAVLAAWLRTFDCPVLNPPRAATLGGPVASQRVWQSVARAHGLDSMQESGAATVAIGQRVTLLWVIDRCIDPTGHAPSWLVSRIARMAHFMGTRLLELTFNRRGREWQLVNVDPVPRIEPTRTDIIDAMIAHARRLHA